MFYPDLTEFRAKHANNGPVLAVGWLDTGHPFPTARPEEDLLDALWAFTTVAILPIRGFHPCPFCPLDREQPIPPKANQMVRHGETRMLGSAEIVVFGADGTVFSAPNLIYHYVAVEHYQPPAAFIDAALNGPRPPDPVYMAMAEPFRLF